MADEDIRLPTLDVILDDAYSVTGDNFIGIDAPTASDKEPKFTRPEETELTVDCAGIRAAEDVLIDEGETQVSGFESFKKEMTANEKWVFLVSDPDDLVPKQQSSSSAMSKEGPAVPAEKHYTDPNPGQTQQIIDGEHALIRAIGDSIHSIGSFTAMLNNAAQFYARADLNSMPPSDAVPIP